MSGATVLQTRDLRSGYGDVEVVHGIDLHVDAGELVALLGPNGAGKTTTLLTIAGLLPPISGTVELFGHEQAATSRRRTTIAALRRRQAGLALVPEDRALFPGLTAREHLRLAARRGDHDAVEQALSPFPALRAIVDRRAGVMSGGEQQMLAVARALAARPRALLIDELSLGLAPIVVETLLPRIAEVAHDLDVGVLLVEQHVGAALSVADRAVVLVRGEIVASGDAAQLAGDAEALARAYVGRGDGAPRHLS